MNSTLYYKKAVLIPSLIVLLFMIGYSLITNYNYESEWISNESWIVLEAFITLIIISLHLLFALPILLIKLKLFRESPNLVILTFLPSWLFSMILFYQLINPSPTEMTTPIIFVFPFLIGSIYSYVHLKKEMRNIQFLEV